MAARKCPKCELNYILDDQPYCIVCTKEMKGIDHHDDEGEICPICGEREVAAGEEYCAECLAEMKKLDSKHNTEEQEIVEETEQIDTIDVIEDDVPLDEETEAVPLFELEHINEELGGEEEPFLDEEDEKILEEEFPDDAEELFNEAEEDDEEDE
jgi:hypothetical protein